MKISNQQKQIREAATLAISALRARINVEKRNATLKAKAILLEST